MALLHISHGSRSLFTKDKAPRLEPWLATTPGKTTLFEPIITCFFIWMSLFKISPLYFSSTNGVAIPEM